MKYCPRCETEYLDHAERCADCNVSLVDEGTLRSSREDGKGSSRSGEMVMLCAVGDQVEADQILDVLGQEGISGYLRTFEETVYIGHSDMHQGFGEIWVPHQLANKARYVVKELWNS